MNVNPIAGSENLKREIGVRSLTLAIINQTVGTGIFVIPALIAANLGPAAVLTYLVCGVLVFLIALCFAELGSQTTTSGGAYEYIETAFGPFVGFVANNLSWVSSVFGDAAVANALADTLGYFSPVFAGPFVRACFFTVIFGGLALLNSTSVKNGVRFIELTAFGKIVPLVLLVVGGAAFVSAGHLQWTITPTISNVGAASLLLFYAFMGFDGPLNNGGEIKNVKRTVPLGIFFGVGSVLVLYLSIQLVTQGVLGDSIGANKDAPLAAVAGVLMGSVGVTLLISTTAISMLGTLGGEILSIPRVLFAGARDGLLPNVLARVHPRFGTPYVAIWVYTGCVLVFAIFGGFRQLAVIASASSLIVYLGAVLSTLKLRKKKAVRSGQSFRVPGGPLVPLLAAGVIGWLLSNLSADERMGISLFMAVLALLYFISQYLKRKRARAAASGVPSP